jgi:lipoprotein-anchoring transpeptidase ErfK/SrfK
MAWHKRVVVLAVIILASALWVSSPAMAQTEEGYIVHVIQPGETLSGIARSYGVPMGNIMAANSIADANRIFWGLRLLIPTGEVALPDPATRTSSVMHTVQRGETLFRISVRYNVAMNDIVIANNLANPNNIYAGQLLVIPAPGSEPQYGVAPGGASSAGAVAAGAPAPALPAEELPVPTVWDGRQIIIDLSQQRLYAFENGEAVRQFAVSTGLPATPTVTGDFAIYRRYESQRMRGPDYDLPGVPWVMYFYQSYSIHGTYWHNNFGQPMSHGCVNMRTPEAEWLYNWAADGTPVRVIY